MKRNAFSLFRPPRAHDFLKDPISSHHIETLDEQLSAYGKACERLCRRSMRISLVAVVVTIVAPVASVFITGHLDFRAIVIPGFLTLLAMLPGMLVLLPGAYADVARNELAPVALDAGPELLRLLSNVPEGALLAQTMKTEPRSFVNGELNALRREYAKQKSVSA
jgi:hypothetical protein